MSQKQILYQDKYTAEYSDTMQREDREPKARKAIAVLENYLGGLGHLKLLEIGCSVGYQTNVYAKFFKQVIAMDIDEAAVTRAKNESPNANVEYVVADAMKIDQPSGSFDVIACSHIYEHVPDATKLISEIHRLLKPGGICYFAAGNRLTWSEPHYHLPLLSVIPKWLAHPYLKIARGKSFFYETTHTVWTLRRLVKKFRVVDYTPKIIDDPNRFHATDMLTPGSLKHAIGKVSIRLAYWLAPTYIWLLKKENSPS